MLATARNAPANARKARTGDKVQASTISLASKDLGNSAFSARVQHLRRLGIVGPQAHVIAGFAWNEVKHG